MDSDGLFSFIVSPCFERVGISKLLLWHVLVLINNHVIVLAFKDNASGVQQRLDGVVSSVILELLALICVCNTSPFCDVEVIDLPAVRLVMFVGTQSNIGAFTPLTI